LAQVVEAVPGEKAWFVQNQRGIHQEKSHLQDGR
jgi:hypothetical protein